MKNRLSAGLPDTVSLSADGRELVIIDQTKLPGSLELISLSTPGAVYEAIKQLRVRGAPAIGVSAALGLYVCALRFTDSDPAAFTERLRATADYIDSSRPTAVNLSFALAKMKRAAEEALSSGGSIGEILSALKAEALLIRDEDIEMCRAIGENALSLLHDGDGILTHCNAGKLAAVRYGTALAPIHLGLERGMSFRVFADETRPLLQGARLTAFELSEAGADVTVICDSMASQVMKNGWISAVLAGADRIAANGDVCNKIGTSGVAILARHYGIPFYVLAPGSTIDRKTPDGSKIVIEERAGEEITDMWYQKRMAPDNVRTYNPAFDVTDAAYITAIITERGIHKRTESGFSQLTD